MDLDLFCCLVFVAGLLLLGMAKLKKIQSENHYLMAGRSTSLFALTATLVMTELNSATLISFASMGYLAGPWGLSLPCVFLVGLTFYALSVAKKWKGFDGVSVASYFSKRYGRDIGLMASCALLLAMGGFSAVYVKSLTLLLSPFFPQVGHWLLSFVLVSFILATMVRGGLVSIIRTDVLSFIVALIFFPSLAYFAYQIPSNGENLVLNGPLILPPRLVLSFILLTMFTYILAPWYGQKIFAAKSQKTAYFAVLFSAVFVFAFYGLAVIATWCFRISGAVVPSPEQALPFTMMQALPVGLKGLGYGMLFAASATTLTGVWSAMTTLVVGDFLSSKASTSYKRSMLWSIGFALSSFLLANILVDKVFDKLVLANIPIAALSFALLAGFYWKRASRVGAILSIITGWAVGIFTYLYFGEEGIYTWYWAIWGIPLIFCTGITGSLLYPDKHILQSN